MSDIDPDLQSTEGNQPVAIDVVGGNLIVKRHGGRKESFPLGGPGGPGFNDGAVLSFLATQEVVPSVDPSTMAINGGNFNPLIEWVRLSNDDKSQWDVISKTSADLDVAGDSGIVMGDYIIQRNSGGQDLIYFRHAGLYWMTMGVGSSTSELSEVTDWKVNITASMSSSLIGASYDKTVDYPRMPQDWVSFPIIGSGVTLDQDHLNDLLYFDGWQSSGIDCQLEVQVAIIRVS